jgi:hypothetical protein
MTRLWPEGEPVAAWGGKGTPEGFAWQGVSHHILDVCNRWRIHTRWWEPGEAIWREYLKVITDTGLLCLLYRDLLLDGWFLARVYD